MKSKILIALSLSFNVLIVAYWYYQGISVPPPFEPFHDVEDVYYSSLVSDGYEHIVVDVVMIGKTIGDLTMHYQFDELKEKASWRNAIIDLKSKEVDTLKVYELIESYDADIVTISNFGDKKLENRLQLTSPFFVKHRINKHIFMCELDNWREGNYEINCSLSSSIENDTLIQLRKDWLWTRTRFGADIVYYEDGRIHITNYFDWKQDGEEKWLRSDGSIEKISIYDQGVLQKTQWFDENGELESEKSSK